MSATIATLSHSIRRKLSCVVAMWLFLCTLTAQNNKIEIREIYVTGLKRTLPNTILREVYFHSGDSLELQALPEIFQFVKTRILSTGLAVDLKINMKQWNVEKAYTDIEIAVKEAHYFYPIPSVQLADRNFNIWFNEQKASLSRINLGLNNYWLNPTGRAEVYQIGLLTGYTNRIDVNFYHPALNTSRTIGLKLGANYSNSKEIGYQTTADRLVFKKLSKPALTKAKIYLGLVYRPKTYATHQLQGIYQQFTIADSIAQSYNSDFLGLSATKLDFFSLRYAWDFDLRNLKVFATKGYMLSGYVQKDGILRREALNRITIGLGYEQYWSLSRRTFLDIKNKFQVNHYYNSRIPYITNRGLGYEKDYLRGYEYYVIDGQNYVYSKVNLKYLFYEKAINLGKMMPFHKLRTMPLQLFWSLYNDLGYVDNRIAIKTNQLQNRFLYGFGTGMNILLYNNKLIQIEWSWNHLFEKSLFLHYDIGF